MIPLDPEAFRALALKKLDAELSPPAPDQFDLKVGVRRPGRGGELDAQANAVLRPNSVGAVLPAGAVEYLIRLGDVEGH